MPGLANDFATVPAQRCMRACDRDAKRHKRGAAGFFGGSLRDGDDLAVSAHCRRLAGIDPIVRRQRNRAHCEQPAEVAGRNVGDDSVFVSVEPASAEFILHVWGAEEVNHVRVLSCVRLKRAAHRVLCYLASAMRLLQRPSTSSDRRWRHLRLRHESRRREAAEEPSSLGTLTQPHGFTT
jgi:hypothetical protein